MHATTLGRQQNAATSNVSIPADGHSPHPVEIYKAHQAISLVPTKGSRITLLMRRFFNVLLQHAQGCGPMETYRAPLDRIFAGADYGSANYEVAKNALRNMAKRPWSGASLAQKKPMTELAFAGAYLPFWRTPS